MSETPLPDAPEPDATEPDAPHGTGTPFLARLRGMPLLTMALNVALIATIFVTRKSWDAWHEDHILPGLRAPLHTASRDGTKIAVNSRKRLVLWNVKERREIASLPRDLLAGYRQFFAAGTRFFVMPMSGGRSTGGEVEPSDRRTPVVFDARTGERLFELAAGAIPSAHASFSSGNRVFIPYEDGTNRIWDGATGRVVADLRTSRGLYGGAFSPDGSRLITIDESGRARLWDANSGRELRELGVTGGLLGVSFAVGGTRILIPRFARDSAACEIIDAETGARIASLEAGRNFMGLVWAVSPDGRLVATCCKGEVLVADAETGAALQRLRAGRTVSSLKFSPRGGLLLGDDFLDSCEWESIWDVRTGRCIYTSPDPMVSLQFTPDESRFVVEAGFRAVEVRSAASGRVLERIPGGEKFHVLSDETMVTSRDGGDVRIFRRRRPEWWWGVFWLPHFWVIAALALALVLSGWRDLRRLRRVDAS